MKNKNFNFFLFVIYIIIILIILNHLFIDEINILRSKASNLIHNGDELVCIDTHMDENNNFKPNTTFTFSGCSVYLPTTKYRINSYGLRGPEISLIKPNKSYRIISLGDSVTFGWGINEKDTFSNVLEKKLKKKSNKNIEVINLGIPGYSALDEVAQFETLGLKFNPDMVLITFVGNDWENEELMKIHDDFLLNLTKKNCPFGCSEEEELSSYFATQNYMRNAHFFDTFATINNSYRRIDEIAKTNNMVVVAGFFGGGGEWKLALFELCKELGWECVDLKKFHHIDYARYFLNVADTHPNKLAHKEIAKIYEEKIINYCK